MPNPQFYRTIIIVGGGCYGSYYLTQLHRARKAGAVEWRRLVVVDKDAKCKVATGNYDLQCELIIQDWRDFFNEYLSACSSTDPGTDAIVPSPLMPHLMYEWLISRAKARWPNREINTAPIDPPLATPWHNSAPDATHYTSFATWMCPINCIEPRLCPHTKGPRDWDMVEPARAYVQERRQARHKILGPFLFQCTHRAYGVGMFETAEVVKADEVISREGGSGPVDCLIGTISHCHGAFNLLRLG